MEFKKNSKTRKWETIVDFRDQQTSFRISTSHDESQLPEIVEKSLARTLDGWESLERNLTDALLDEYNETWSEPERGFPELSRRKFLDKLSIDHFSVDENSDEFRLFLNDGGMFGDQEIVVFWDADSMQDAAIVG